MKNETLNNSLHKSFTLNINSREKEIKWPNESSSVSSGLIYQLKDINNSPKQLSHGTKRTSAEILIHLWSSLWPFSSGQSASSNDDAEGTPLTEILAEGEFIHQQAESLQDSKNKQVSCYGWKGSYLKRYLVGVGLLTGAGVIGGLGFRYYAGRNGYNESKDDFAFPILTGPYQNHFTSIHNCQMDFDRVALPSDLFIARNCEYNSEMDFINKVVTQPLDFISEFNTNIRKKRSKRSITIKNDYIPNLILSIWLDSTLDWRVTNEFDLIFRHADASPDVRNAKSSEEKNIKLLLKTIQITQQCIDNNKYGHAKYKAFESFSDILKKLWDIANNLPDAYSKQAVKKFKEIYSHMSTTIEPHNSSDASHGTTVPTPIAEPRIIDNTVGNDTSVGIGVVVGGGIIGAGAAGAAGCTSCVKGGANAGSVASGVGGVASGVGGVASGIGGVASGIGGVASGVGGVASGIGGVASGVGGVASGVGGVASGVGGSSSISGINADKIAERIHSREWNKIPSRDANPPKFEPEKNEIPQMWPDTDMQGGSEVEVGGMETVTDSTTILSTRGLSDCSALIVLSDWNGVSYGSRTLIHLNGSNVSYGLKYGSDASGLISELHNKIIGGGKVILVGGDLSQSNVGLGITIGQENNSGRKPLYELMSTPGISLDISGSSQVYVYPDGTFKLGDIEGERGVLTQEEVNNILSQLTDDLIS